MIIPYDLAQETVRMFLANEYPPEAVKTLEQPVLCESEPSYDVTAMPADVPAPFAVNSVYRFLDVYGRQREAYIYAEQWARVGQAWWHVGSIPDDAVCVGTFTPDPALIADAARFAREIVNSQEWG